MLTLADLTIMDRSEVLALCPDALQTFVHAYLNALSALELPGMFNSNPRHEYAHVEEKDSSREGGREDNLCIMRQHDLRLR
jgi:hypothetical protein